MTFPLILFFICAAVTVFFFRRISVGKVNALIELAKQKQAVESKYDYLLRKKAGLKKELARKERRLATLVNNQEGIRIKTASEMHLEEETEDDRISNLLISMGKLSVEQNEKVRKKMDVLKMDYLATCLTLGFIDAETSKMILKRHK